MSDVLPNANSAILEIQKLTAYCLEPSHPEGSHKARVFRSALGLQKSDAFWLRGEILKKLPGAGAIRQIEDTWGVRYAVDMDISRDAKSARVRTVWIVERNDTRPRFVTCRVI